MNYYGGLTPPRPTGLTFSFYKPKGTSTSLGTVGSDSGGPFALGSIHNTSSVYLPLDGSQPRLFLSWTCLLTQTVNKRTLSPKKSVKMTLKRDLIFHWSSNDMELLQTIVQNPILLRVIAWLVESVHPGLRSAYSHKGPLLNCFVLFYG